MGLARFSRSLGRRRSPPRSDSSTARAAERPRPQRGRLAPESHESPKATSPRAQRVPPTRGARDIEGKISTTPAGVSGDVQELRSFFPRRAGLQIRFGPFTLDLDTRQLTRDGREIHLSPKAFELLATLAVDRPKVLSKVVLQQRLWPETFVAEANLSNLVAEIREALGDEARAPLFIRTAHGFGYAFCGEATTPGAPEPEPDQQVCWLEWGQRRFHLSAGEHVVGRDPDVEVRLDASTVSRRHARIVVTAEGTVLEDFGSKNGTFRGTERVTSPVQLADGDAIRIGSLLVTFHVRAPGSTETQVLSPV